MKFKFNWIIFAFFAATYLLCTNKAIFSMEMDIVTTSGSDTEDWVPSSDSEAENYSDLDPLNDITLLSMTIDDWINRPSISNDILYLTDKFIQNSSAIYQSSNWLYNENINTQLTSVLTSSVGTTLINTTDFPCIEKIIVPKNTRVAIIGDIHADMDTVEEIFHSLKKKSFINDNLTVADNCRIIFLGDYTDRGAFNLKVISSALILANKNPTKVFLLKGNHEALISNIPGKNSEIITEIKESEKNITQRDRLINNIIKTYQLMPVAMFLGFENKTQTEYYFLAHGGPDIRYDYANFLDMQVDRSFWMLKDENILETDVIIKLFKDAITHLSQKRIKLHIKAPLTFGFLWNDIIASKQVASIIKSHRGDACIKLDPEFIRYFLQSFSTINSRVVGVIRGHQHLMTKDIEFNIASEKLSPNCSFFSTKSIDGKILIPNIPIFFKNIFPIVTVISGPVVFDQEIIEYVPNFLELNVFENGLHKIETASSQI